MVLALARTLHAETGERNLCLAGGVALNCVANGRLLREGPFDDVWIQPAAGDAGGAIGAALFAWHARHHPGRVAARPDAMRRAYLGPEVWDAEASSFLGAEGLPFEALAERELGARVAALLAAGAVVGWVQGRMEFGPRALGNRSILGDPRDPGMQRRLNLKTKFRESFRPFAPSVTVEEAGRFFEIDRPSPYMLLTAAVRGPRAPASGSAGLMERLYEPRSSLPAITHVDYSARLHTVERDANPRFHALLVEFARLTGTPVLINTSFNVRGEPIVCSIEDACRCFLATDMDYLVVGNCLLGRDTMPDTHRLRAARQFDPD